MTQLKIITLLTGVGMIAAATAQHEESSEPANALSDGTATLDLRYRYEDVHEKGFDEHAQASLLRTRLTLESASTFPLSARLEVDNVSSIGADNYNSTENGLSQYPTIADPEGTDINQAWLGYSQDGLLATAGRQRILLGDKRFIGSKPWRNNEQTYDGVRLRWTGPDQLSIDASYVNRVNRVFGPGDGANPAHWRGDNIFLRGNYAIADGHRLTAFGYWLDVDAQDDFSSAKTVNNSSDTLGIEYALSLAEVDLRATWAWQQDAGSSELDYTARYYVLELGTRQWGLSINAAYEVLAADNGVGFATPLANGHGYQGWADKFLSTPPDGLEDAWISLGGKIGPVELTARYHDFRAEASSVRFGTEIDLQAQWTLAPKLTATVKAALFDARTPQRYADTEKFWLMLQYNI